jgi:hypothetical protein
MTLAMLLKYVLHVSTSLVLTVLHCCVAFV